MAKKKEEVIEPRCDYCLHNKGENQQFKFMWLCENLCYCVPFGYNFCKAEKQNKGKFKIDREKYKEYLNNKQK